MSVTKRIFFGAAASWFSRAVTIALGMVLLPVLFRSLPREELGVWLLLGQTWAALGVLDLGFAVTLTREIAFAKGRSGSNPNAPLSGEALDQIADLLATGLRIFRILAFGALTLSFLLGALYLDSLDLNEVPTTRVWGAWFVLCLSSAFTIWAAPWTCLLQGVGYIGWDAILASFVNALTLIVQIIAVFFGGGMVSLAIVAVVGALSQRFVLLSFASRKRPELFRLKGVWRSEIFHSMRPLALRAWLTALGASLILYTDQFIIASMKNPTELPAYRAAWVLVHNATVVAVSFASASGVFISQLWHQNELPQIHRLLRRNLRLGWLFMLGAATMTLSAGELFFAAWLGSGNFVGYPILVAFLITETLEMQAFTLGTAARATGAEVFAAPAIIAGVIKVLLSFLLVAPFGLLGVALATGVALLISNHWYVPMRSLHHLKYRWQDLILGSIAPSAFLWSLVALLLFTTLQLAPNIGDPARLLTCLCFGCIGLASGIWILVLDPSHRRRIIDRAFRPRSS